MNGTSENDKKRPDKKISMKKKIGLMALDATKIIATEASRYAIDNIKQAIKKGEKVEVKPPSKPTNQSTFQFVRQVRPVKTYTQARRTVEYVEKHPEATTIKPGLDGLVSFSLLLVPAAFILGIMLLQGWIGETAAFFLLLLYVLLVAIPGGYLGIDGLAAGAKGILDGFLLFFKTIWELAILTISGLGSLLFGFARGAFDVLEDYIGFVSVFLLSSVGLYFLLESIFPGKIASSPFLLTLMVIFPALFPAALVHRQYKLWRLRQTKE